MTIKELKDKIKDLPDDMLVGNTGHFGEYLPVLDCRVHYFNPWCYENFVFVKTDIKTDIFCISIEDKGEEPD